MIDPVQVVVLLIMIVLTALLVMLGVQAFFILKDFRKTLHKANDVLDDTHSITEKVSEPLQSLSGVMTGIKTGAMIAKLLKTKDKNDKDGE